MRKLFPILVLAVLAVSSCEFINSLIHDDEVVARVGKRKLYRSQVEALVPPGVSSADSTNIALQYIHNWAMDLLYSEVAAQQLTKAEQDVSGELEDYRNSLLKFRYEQRYINERLDTAVTPEQIRSYYDSHREMFMLDVPIVKGRFLDIMQESPNLEVLRIKMAGKAEGDLAEADSIAYLSALRYEDKSDVWMDMPSFARYFGTDYGTVLANLDKDGYIDIRDERGDAKIAYVCELMRPGRLAPEEYCIPRIRDIIISNRKRELLLALEQDLLSDALEKNTLIIY